MTTRALKTTVLGGSGFIGSHLGAHLRSLGHDCWLPQRDDPAIFQQHLGTVFYCIGMTADFRSQPYATVDAHVGVLRNILQNAHFDQLIYLSSTRVYAGCPQADETQTLRALPARADDLYNLSKMLGESLALASGRPCRIARLANVIGPGMGTDNFVGALIEEARYTGRVLFKTAPESSKNYLWIDDACAGLVAIAEAGRETVYNLAGTGNISNASLAELLASRGITVAFSGHAPVTTFAEISIAQLVRDTGFQPTPVLPLLAIWLDSELAMAQRE